MGSIFRWMMVAALFFSLWEGSAPKAQALTADKVWFEFHPGFYRVYVRYTLPKLKVWRTAYVDFTSKKQAERFHWSLVWGADFSLIDPKQIRYPVVKRAPEPW